MLIAAFIAQMQMQITSRKHTAFRQVMQDMNTWSARIVHIMTSAAAVMTVISRVAKNVPKRRYRMKTIHDYIAIIVGTLHNASEVAFAQAVMAIEMLYEGRC